MQKESWERNQGIYRGTEAKRYDILKGFVDGKIAIDDYDVDERVKV